MQQEKRETVSMDRIVELNVGGKIFMTKVSTLTNFKDSLLGKHFEEENNLNESTNLILDPRGRYFIDKDPCLFRFILDFMRTKSLVLPENFNETERLIQEATWFNLPELIVDLKNKSFSNFSNLQTPRFQLEQYNQSQLNFETGQTNNSSHQGQLDTIRSPGFITLGYRGTFASGRGDLADVKFRKLNRILVCGRVNLCREAFGETLNESRDPDKGSQERYSSRLFLKHTSLERAFESLTSVGFYLVSSAGTAASQSTPDIATRRSSLVPPGSAQPSPRNTSKKGGLLAIPSDDMNGLSWDHYNEFYFQRK